MSSQTSLHLPDWGCPVCPPSWNTLSKVPWCSILATGRQRSEITEEFQSAAIVYPWTCTNFNIFNTTLSCSNSRKIERVRVLAVLAIGHGLTKMILHLLSRNKKDKLHFMASQIEQIESSKLLCVDLQMLSMVSMTLVLMGWPRVYTKNAAYTICKYNNICPHHQPGPSGGIDEG